MPDLAVLTPCYRGDAELLPDLHQSVLECTPADTVHHVVVPPSDRALFTKHQGPRCRVWTHRDFLPRRYVCIPHASGLAVNSCRPWPPVRGWVVQQAIKIAASRMLEAGTVLIADSDAVLVRPMTAEQFRLDGRLRLFRAEHAVHAGMPRHVCWHGVARRLLGLPPAPDLPLPDYVNAINVWDPKIVLAMQQRITEVTGRNWLDAVTSELHISEFVLYGVFVDEVLGRPPALDAAFCHNYYSSDPLDREQALAFADRMTPDAVGVMISSHSGTPRQVRRATFDRCRAATRS
jgi:hypothetical protein